MNPDRHLPTLRPARAGEARRLAEFASEASSGVEDYVWLTLRHPDRPDRDLHDIGAAVYATPDAPWGFENVTVAEVGGEVAGMVHHFRLEQDDEPGDDPVLAPYVELEDLAAGDWYISNMAVAPAFRGRGAGRSLLDHAIATGRAAGAPAISLLVFTGNAAAVGLYESAGFVQRESRPVPPHELIRGVGDIALMTRGY